MGKYRAEYGKCPGCGYLWAVDPHWLDEAYGDPITRADTGLVARNIRFSHQLSVLLYHHFNPRGRFLDYAGGYGLFTRLMRDAGFSFFHTDPYTENLFARDFEWDDGPAIEGVTCFECFEHLVDPMKEIGKILGISRNLFFSTVLLPEPVPPPAWHYYAFDHGQHVSFYAHATLQRIAEMSGLHFVSCGNLHFFSERPVNPAAARRLVRNADRPPWMFRVRSRFERVRKRMKGAGS